MPELRWILLLLGLAVVAAVYWLGRREQRRRAADGPPRAPRFEPNVTERDLERRRLEPRLEGEPAIDDRSAEGHSLSHTPARETTDQGDSSGVDKIIVLRLAPPRGERLKAREVVDALRAENLEHGRYRIFHCYADSEDAQPIFSIASMVEPGSFDLERLEGVALPGLTLFAMLPGPLDGVDTLNRMLETARRLAIRLECVLQDEAGDALSNQRIGHIRDEIIEFQLLRASGIDRDRSGAP